MAPEVLKCPFKSHPDENKDNTRLHYCGGVDSWAIGVLSYELLVGCPPFYSESRSATEERIFSTMPAMPEGISEEVRGTIHIPSLPACSSPHQSNRVPLGRLWLTLYPPNPRRPPTSSPPP
jgi:serine/threonine protein kinase